MKVTNHSVQAFLFRDKGQRFKLGGSAIVAEAPNWVMTNKYALSLREEEKISFESKKIAETPKQKLMARADELGVIYGDGITVVALEALINTKEKQLEDAKK